MLSRRAVLAVLAAPPPRGLGRNAPMFSNAEAYQRFMGRWSRLLAPLFIGFSRVPGTARLLDLGSGTGSLSFALAAQKPRCRVDGIDPSAEYVRYASARNPSPDRVRFRVGDAQAIDFPSAAFDGCLSLLVFNFIPDPQMALREAVRVTRPGGVISAAVWDYANGMAMLRTFWDAVAETDPSSPRVDEARMPLCGQGQLGTLWRQLALEHVSERPLEFAMRFESFADYWEPFLLGQGPAGAYVVGLDATRREALRAVVLRRLALSSPDRPFSLSARAWAVRGTIPHPKPRSNYFASIL